MKLEIRELESPLKGSPDFIQMWDSDKRFDIKIYSDRVELDIMELSPFCRIFSISPEGVKTPQTSLESFTFKRYGFRILVGIERERVVECSLWKGISLEIHWIDPYLKR